MPSVQPERRKYLRRNIFVPIMCWEVDRGKSVSQGIPSVSKDLSENGVSFKSKAIYPVGVELHAEIYLPNRKHPVATQLKVVSVEAVVGKDSYIIGAVFAGISAEDRDFVARCLDRMSLYKILDIALKRGASDVHLTVGHPPIFRIRGRIYLMEETPNIEDGQIRAMIYPLLSELQIDHFERKKEFDFAFSPDTNSRFRVNLHIQKGFMEAALRSIPAGTRNLKELGLPIEPLQRLCNERSGIVIISGRTGAGKTTTLAAMIDYINRNLEKVVITIEDPVEYIHTSQKSIIKQRELGSDTQSYAEALRHTLRQDPDVIVVGELLDSDSVLAAVRAAETGHLVITTIHAPDTSQTLERIINLFPPEHVPSVRQQISTCLIGLLYQMLLPDKKGNLVVATELLMNNSAIRNTIREGQFAQIRSYIQTGSSQGMFTLENELKKLIDKGVIEAKVLQQYDRVN